MTLHTFYKPRLFDFTLFLYDEFVMKNKYTIKKEKY